MSCIDANELVFNNDKNGGIYSGGFSVNSIMMKRGISPIITLNGETIQKGGVNNVSDIFNDLVVPNWAISYPTMHGGNHSESNTDNNYPDYSDIIEDDIHDQLLALVKQYDVNIKKKRSTKKNINPKNSKGGKNNKGGTKKNK